MVRIRRTRGRSRHVEVESVQQHAGVGEQSDGGCPHTEQPLPCPKCFFGGDEADA
jgi:hypothetical protein